MIKSFFLAFALVTGPALLAETGFTRDSQRQEGVPVGKITRHEHRSKIFEGTLRQYYLYVPAQYKTSEPAAVMVFQDGHAYVDEKGQARATIVLDNLIHRGEIPVTIGIFINPGVFDKRIDGRQDWSTGKKTKTSNRSVEYDSLNEVYARMLETEILPEIGKNFTLTKNPERRVICGASSGGICAFTVAWERPDLFRKVISHIGSFTNIRGGHVYPALIRKEKKRPLRVWLQDGRNDLDNSHGNWWLSNQQMAKSLAFAKYDYKFVATDGGHSIEDGGRLLPDALRWIWRK
ncbi:alpha/beta hydrolase-fold protein [bacterium]|nr:alpha/beta hydrolase-fold protein [bacterium]MDA7930594.1 alpha/beta hydrolase-fold protein [Akkermansiaceae bacterium]MDB4423690.1 alpha/beta hydrolase-fold protein [bacterium]MDB4466233.1 alpha/beta hydrolase-fold protein [bacterium]MDB4484542.1 alpha/beta hydrolase-fold protein [bacterium]